MRLIMKGVGVRKMKYDYFRKFSTKNHWIFYSWSFYDRGDEVIKRGLRVLGLAIHFRETSM